MQRARPGRPPQGSARVARSFERHSRRSRGGDEAQVSQVEKMGAAQGDLRAGSSFTIPEAASAGW